MSTGSSCVTLSSLPSMIAWQLWQPYTAHQSGLLMLTPLSMLFRWQSTVVSVSGDKHQGDIIKAHSSPRALLVVLVCRILGICHPNQNPCRVFNYPCLLGVVTFIRFSVSLSLSLGFRRPLATSSNPPALIGIERAKTPISSILDFFSHDISVIVSHFPLCALALSMSCCMSFSRLMSTNWRVG